MIQLLGAQKILTSGGNHLFIFLLLKKG